MVSLCHKDNQEDNEMDAELITTRVTALQYALQIVLSPVQPGPPDVNQLIKEAKLIEAYLKGKDGK